MKHLLFSFFIILAIPACSTTETSYAFEEDLLECWYNSQPDGGVTMKDAVDELTKAYIHYGYLEDQSGKSFIQFLRSLEEINDLPFPPSEALIAEVRAADNFPYSITCADPAAVNLVDYEQSTYKYLIAATTDSITNKGDMSVGIIAGELLEVLDEHDFEHSFYRTNGILMITNLIRASDREFRIDNLPQVKARLEQ